MGVKRRQRDNACVTEAMSVERVGGWLARCAASLLLWLVPSLALASDPLALVLNWVPGADHAPFIFALRQGWYAQAGIALTVDSVAGSPEAIKRATRDPGTLAVTDFISCLRARSGTTAVTAVMALQPLSPYAVYFSAASGIERVQDLAGKRIAAQPQDPMRRLWQPLAQRNAVAADSVSWVDRSNAAKPDALAAGEADAAFNPFLHNHLNYVAVLGADMRVLWWHELGFAAYGQVLVAPDELIRRSPELVRRFVGGDAASLGTVPRAASALRRRPGDGISAARPRARAGSMGTGRTALPELARPASTARRVRSGAGCPHAARPGRCLRYPDGHG